MQQNAVSLSSVGSLAAHLPVVESAGLMAGGREIVIQHAGQSYRLRVTRANKLILTK